MTDERSISPVDYYFNTLLLSDIELPQQRRLRAHRSRFDELALDSSRPCSSCPVGAATNTVHRGPAKDASWNPDWRSPRCLPPVGQPPRCVEDTQDLDRLVPNAIRHDVMGLGHDQFTRASHSAWSTEPRLRLKVGNGVEYALDDQTRRRCIASCDVGGFVIEIAQRLAQPSNPRIPTASIPCPSRIGRVASTRCSTGLSGTLWDQYSPS